MVGYSKFFIPILVVLLSSNNLPALAQQDSPLLDALQRKMSNSQVRINASFAGKDRALICSYCHGEDGNSLKPEVPNLAGQNPAYLLEQIGNFASGKRKDYVMNSLASKFTDDDQVNLAIYYAGKKVKPEKFDISMAAKGKQTYAKNCRACHGNKGEGNQRYARLAGQRQAYIKKTLRRFRANSIEQSDRHKRRSTVMEPIAGQLSDQDIQNLAAYIASLR